MEHPVSEHRGDVGDGRPERSNRGQASTTLTPFQATEDCKVRRTRGTRSFCFRSVSRRCGRIKKQALDGSETSSRLAFHHVAAVTFDRDDGASAVRRDKTVRSVSCLDLIGNAVEGAGSATAGQVISVRSLC